MSAFGGKADIIQNGRSSSLVVSRATIPPRAPGVFMRRRDFITIFGAAGILIGQSSVFAQTFRTYNCYDGSQFILAFFEGDKRAHLQLDGKAITLPAGRCDDDLTQKGELSAVLAMRICGIARPDVSFEA
jgi:hypothetical protein